MTPDTLFIFTNEYPYGYGETYLENELKILSEKFNRILLFPLHKKGIARMLPKANIETVVLFNTSPIQPTLPLFFNNIYSFFSILLSEFINSTEKKKFICMIANLKSRLLQNIFRAEQLEKFIDDQTNRNIFFYSFWTDDWATALSILKRQKKITDFISRVHGYDLYKERWPSGIIPFRYLQLKQVKTIFTVSKDGLNYMTQHYPAYQHKFKLKHLNVFEEGTNPWNETSVFTIVTCSNLIPLKRVQLILDAVKYIDFDLKWFHFGDGELGASLKLESDKLSKHIEVHFKGAVPNTEILQFYRNHCINLFIHMSETEGGVPLALQEAASFGIPLLAADSGGVCEIVTESTGILTKNTISPEELGSMISTFKNSYRNKPAFRKEVKEYWKQHFDAAVNYVSLYNYFLRN